MNAYTETVAAKVRYLKSVADQEGYDIPAILRSQAKQEKAKCPGYAKALEAAAAEVEQESGRTTLDVAGMTYSREPDDGERVVIRTREGDMIGVYVYAVGRDNTKTLIAGDQIEAPRNIDRRKAAIKKRVFLANAAAKHWSSKGFQVENFA